MSVERFIEHKKASIQTYKYDKEQNQKNHFKKRFQERVNVFCNKFIYNDLKSHKDVLVYNSTNRLYYYLYLINNKYYILCYDKIRDTFVTIIPEIFFNERQKSDIEKVNKNKIKKLKHFIYKEIN